MAQPQNNDLSKSLGFQFIRLARQMKRALELRSIVYDLTASQYIVLVSLWEEDGIRLSQLGNKLYFDNPTITGIIDRMEKAGLVERKRETGDRRAIRIFLTPRGKSLKSRIPRAVEEVDQISRQNLSPEQIQQFLRTLNIIWKNLNRDQE
jgi:DNA-binding MarR family transcriptional regulator